MSGDSTLEVHLDALKKAGVGMRQVAQGFTTLTDQIGQGCGLPVGSLSFTGELARNKYESGRNAASKAATDLAGRAAGLAKGAAGSAVGYVKVEAANVQAVEEAASQSSVSMDKDLQDIFRGGGVYGTYKLLIDTGIRGAQYESSEMRAAAEADGLSAGMDIELENTLDSWEAHEKLFAPDGEAGAAGRSLGTLLEDKINVEDEISIIGRLSKSTGIVLQRCSRFAPAALIASTFWMANNIVESDGAINKAITGWRGVAAAATTISTVWMPEIESALAAKWKGQAGAAALDSLRRFATDGKAFADRAQRMGTSLANAVKILNRVYQWAFAFAMAQFAMLIALAALMVYAPFAPWAVTTMRVISTSLSVWLTAFVNVVLAVLSGLLPWMAV
jgi:hypothetical protein